MKKGQVTLFIIIGVILLLVGIVAFVYYTQVREVEIARPFELPLELQPVQQYVNHCIEQSVTPGIYLLGLQGGSIFPQDPIFPQGDLEIVYWVDGGRRNIPEILTMEEELAIITEDAILDCIDFSIFSQFTIIEGELSVQTSILGDQVLFEIIYPLTIVTAQDERINLREFSAMVDIPLGNIRNLAEELANNYRDNPDRIELPPLLATPFQASFTPVSGDTIMFSILDNVSRELGPYIFQFAVRNTPNNRPDFSLPESFTVPLFSSFSYQVQVDDPDGDVIEFEDDSPIFDIDASGLIAFTPRVPGEFSVTITADDGENAVSRTTTFKIVRTE